MNYIFFIVPLLVFLAVLKYTDSFTLVSWKHIVFSICGGVAVCFCALMISRAMTSMELVFYSPLVEELLKAVLLAILVLRKRIVFVEQALCYGAAIGAGFALAENIVYFTTFTGMTGGTAFFRGVGTTVMHMACPMISGTFICCCALSFEAGERVMGILLSCIGVFIAVAIHALFNMMLLPLWVQLGLTVLVFTVTICLITAYNEKKVCQWLDQSINNDVSLLKAIRMGQLSQTKQGKYLLAVKSQFDPDTVADMMCYIRLYLEIVIEDKSRMMLREAGLESPLTEQQKAEREAAMAEFRALRQRIGMAGESVLRPIVRVSRDDEFLMGRL